MVKLTIVGRARDGLPLAQGHRYMNEYTGNLASYKQQGEFILKEISRGALASPRMNILVENNHSFYYLVEEGFCFIVLCDSSYPRKLAFHYLQDLQTEFQTFDRALLEKITRPYSFLRFDGIIENYRRQYIDTRTQTNLCKLANRQKDLDIFTEHISEIIGRRRHSVTSERTLGTRTNVSPVWGSPCLEVIAMKWTPITLIMGVATVLLWASLILTDSFVI